MTDILYRYKQIAAVKTNCTSLKIIVLVQKQFVPKVKIKLQHIQVVPHVRAPPGILWSISPLGLQRPRFGILL